MSSSASEASTTEIAVPGKPSWQQTMLRIRDPAKSLAFYRDILGMTLVDTLEFPQYDFTLYFLQSLSKEQADAFQLEPGTQAAHDYLWSTSGTVLELTHNYGTESDESFPGYHAGNQEGDGFGHVAFHTNNLQDACTELESKGVSFKKKPHEGRMRHIAFAYDPDGYWVEILQRTPEGRSVSQMKSSFHFTQTMLRIKDPAKSIPFYKALGMKVVRQSDHGDFSIYFLVSGEAPEAAMELPTDADELRAHLNDFSCPVLELTHNHGTETQADFRHYSGNEDGRKGFGHVGFIVDDVYAACDGLTKFGYGFKKEPDGGSMKGLAFAYDPDGYWVEIVKRGGMDFGDKRKD